MDEETATARRVRKRESQRRRRARRTAAERLVDKQRDRERDRRRYAENPARRETMLKWYANHPEAGRRNTRKWAAAHPEVAVEHSARHRARKLKAPGTGWSTADVEAQYKSQRGKCYYCEIKLRGKFDCDHVIPLAKGGAHCRSNLVLACPSCNRGKRDKDPQDFAGILL